MQRQASKIIPMVPRSPEEIKKKHAEIGSILDRAQALVNLNNYLIRSRKQ